MVIASRAMDQSCLSPFGLPSSNSSSFFSDEIRIPERQVVGFWKPESVVDQTGSKLVFSSSLEKLHPMGANPAGCVGNPGPHTFNSQKGMFSLDNNLVGQEKASSLPSTSWGDACTSYGSRHGFSTKESTFVEPSVDRHLSDYENGGFSSSFSEMFSSKLRLTSNSALGQSNSALGQSVDTNNSNCEEGEPLGSMEEIEAQTIGDLLPDDDDLISGIIDDFEYTGLSTIRDDVDEDIFFTSGGMELENDDALKSLRIPDGFLKGQLFGEHVSGERSSRTLFVRNIDTNIDDSELRVLFQQYGDIDMMYTSCKHRGFVIISYYDIRAAQNAIRALHYKPLGLRNLDIGFSIPKDHLSDKDIGQDIGQGTLVISNLDSSVSKDDLCQILSVYGDIKEIHKASAKCTHNFIEFYDVRAAESARRGLSKNCISGQKIKLEPSHPGVAAYCLTQQCSIELKQEEHVTFLQRPNNSLPGCIGKVVPKSQEIGSFHGLFSSVSPLMDKSLHGINSSVPPKLSSPIKIESIQQHNNKPALGELNESHSRRGIEVFHPRSLPEYQDSMSNNPKSITPSGMNVNSRLAEGVDYSYLHKAGTSRLHGHSFDKNEAFGVSGIGSCPLHGYHYVWNSTNAFPQSPSAPMLWSNLQHPMHVHGFPRPPPHMLNTGALPVDQLRLGSAPAYGGSFTDINSFHPGSLGNVGFHGSPQWYPSEFAVFPPAGGNYREPLFSPVSVGFPSPQQRCHVINGRNHMFNISTSYDAPNDRMRSRRNDVNADQPDNKKQFELDIDHIANGEDSRTTLMIKNIPNKYTCKMLLAVIDENHRGTYDFIYLPIDFKNKCNVGYAFVNMTEPKHIVSFFKTFNGKKWEKFNSEKVASLAYARIQGRCALIAHFQNSSLMNEDKRCRPMLFHKDGPNAGDQEPFPVGNNVRSRPGRNRTFTNLDTQQGSPSSSPNQETSTSGADLPLGSTEDTESPSSH